MQSVPQARIKICGITSVADALLAVNGGADAIGLVFYPPSPRNVAIDTAVAIAAAAGPFVTTVALFVNPEPALVETVLTRVRPHVLQFHGDESPAFCEQFGRPYMKAIRVRGDTSVLDAAAPFRSAAGILFDAWSEDRYGGTGKTFEWDKIKGIDGFPVILAGGLTPENVAEAIALTTPYAVDASGGVEASPGVKDSAKISRFVAEVRAAGRQSSGN
ncbi:MAG: phosphoribosylanthranilate isomerase [Porticoccaceae bacterium]|nr:phosphoribosylanthranilate isomerase [Porticoccaceae bacterium]